MAHISLALMGPFDAALDGEPISWFQTEKARALLAYLAVEQASPHGRHALAGLFWPQVPDDHALHSLSQALCNLRTVLHDQTAPTPCLLITPHAIQFNPHCDHWVDVEEFGRLVHWGATAPTNQPINQSPISAPRHLSLPRPLPGRSGAGRRRGLRGVGGDPARAAAPADAGGVKAVGYTP